MTERKGKQAMEMRGAKRLRVSGQKAPNNNTERVYPGYRNLSSYYTIFTSLLQARPDPTLPTSRPLFVGARGEEGLRGRGRLLEERL